MAIEVKIPPMGESITSGVLAKWHVKDGDLVKKDQPLFELETDKITSEGAAEAAGKITFKVPAGTDVKIGQVVATIDEAAAAGTAPAAAVAPATVAATAAAATVAGLDGPGPGPAAPATLAVSSIVATTWPIFTSVPAGTLKVILPAASAVPSEVILSVSSSKSGWSFLTRSPSLTCHLASTPEVMDSPIGGILTSMAMEAGDMV